MAGSRIRESTWLRACTHLSAEVSEETVILHGTEAVYYGLNSTGTFLWHELKDPISSQQLVKLVAERFRIEPKAVEADVVGVLTEMLEAGLIEIVPRAPTA